MIVADTSGLLTLFNRAEPAHAAAAATVTAERDPIVVSPFVVAELDYLVATRVGVVAELEVLEALASPAFVLAPFGADDLREAAAVVGRYRDQAIGVADASLVVLAERHDTRRILTLDHRHFAVLRDRRGRAFELLPGE